MRFKGKHIDPYESFYWNTTEQFFRGQLGGGISRTVKTDDSLAVMEDINNNGCIQVGNIYPDSENMANRSGGRVNSTTGCAPTILSRDFKQPKMIMEEVKIAAMRGRNPDNPSERGKSNRNYQQRLEVNENGTSNTITSVQKDNLVVEPLNPYEDGTARTIKSQYYKNGRAKFARQDGLGATGVVQIGNIYPDTDGFKNKTSGRVYSAEGLSPTLRTVTGGHNEPKVVLQKQPRYRIRKLTPRECFRLMGCDEETIDIIQAAGISNSQQYKLAGNSIVVDVLYHLFRKMFVETENESQQLTLF